MNRNAKLRSLCREYLYKIRYMAQKHGLGKWVDENIKATRNPDCAPTEHECMMLSRLVNEERLQRVEIPAVLDKSYRQCVDDEDFEHIKKLPRVGVYSKVDALLYAEKIKEKRLWKTTE